MVYKIELDKKDKNIEPMLVENPKRFVLFPIEHHDIWEMYKKAVSAFWTPEEVSLANDMDDWNNKLNDDQRFFIKNVLAFFAASDGIVNENLCMNFANEVQWTEARCFYGFQIAIENVHSEMYSLLIDKFITDKVEKCRLFNAITTIPCITMKANWALKYTDPEKSSLAERMVAFAAVEGIFFSGSFCAVFWLKKSGLLPGLSSSNTFIARDEGLHCDFACLMYNKMVYRLSTMRIHEIIKDAVDIETVFIKDSLPVELVGMNSDMMTIYIKYCADRLIVELGHPKMYNVKNPFPWLEKISIPTKTNFFEHRSVEYSKQVEISGTYVYEPSDDF